MPAARYWRARAFEAYAGASLELGQLHLLGAAGARLCASALLSASSPPAAGSLAALQDADAITTVRWIAGAVPALALTWDFGAGNEPDVLDLRLSGPAQERFPLMLQLQHSTDALTWTTLATYAGIAWPGPGQPTESPGGTLALNTVRGRAQAQWLSTLPTLPAAMVYGTARLPRHMHHTVASGTVRDFTTGVLGLGVGFVAGTVRERATPGAPELPVRRRVLLLREPDFLLMRETWSDATTGAYRFDFVDELRRYTVISTDHTGNFRAVVADSQTPEVPAP